MTTRPAATPRTSRPLDKNSQERLGKLLKDWHPEGADSPFPSYTSISTHDLRLLLEHFEPLRALIRSIAQPELPTASMPPVQSACTVRRTHADSAVDTEAPPAAQPDEDILHALAEQRDDALEQLAQMHAQMSALESRCEAIAADLQACTAQGQQQLADNQELRQQADGLAEQLQQSRKDMDRQRKAAQQAQKKLDDCQAELQFERERASAFPPSPEVDMLRQDAELAQRLDIAPLPDDAQQALIRTVAVLSQRDNLRRLWTVLHERCNAERRSASAAEATLLASALAWHNHNWKTRPYSLLEVAPGSSYDYDRHQRSQHTPAGERIQAQLLPGIVEGSGSVFCKPLVRTG